MFHPARKPSERRRCADIPSDLIARYEVRPDPTPLELRGTAKFLRICNIIGRTTSLVLSRPEGERRGGVRHGLRVDVSNVPTNGTNRRSSKFSNFLVGKPPSEVG